MELDRNVFSLKMIAGDITKLCLNLCSIRFLIHVIAMFQDFFLYHGINVFA